MQTPLDFSKRKTQSSTATKTRLFIAQSSPGQGPAHRFLYRPRVWKASPFLLKTSQLRMTRRRLPPAPNRQEGGRRQAAGCAQAPLSAGQRDTPRQLRHSRAEDKFSSQQGKVKREQKVPVLRQQCTSECAGGPGHTEPDSRPEHSRATEGGPAIGAELAQQL